MYIIRLFLFCYLLWRYPLRITRSVNSPFHLCLVFIKNVSITPKKPIDMSNFGPLQGRSAWPLCPDGLTISLTHRTTVVASLAYCSWVNNKSLGNTHIIRSNDLLMGLIHQRPRMHTKEKGGFLDKQTKDALYFSIFLLLDYRNDFCITSLKIIYLMVVFFIHCNLL